MNWKILIVAIIVMVALAVGMTSTGKSTAQSEIKIGFIGPLTGDFAIIGTENLRGIELAVDEINTNSGINGKKVSLVIEDDWFQPAQTVSAFEKVVTIENVGYVMTVSYSGFLSIAPRADEKRVIVIESLETSKEIADAGEYVFGIGIYDEGIGFTLADFARNNLGTDTAGIIFYNQSS